MASAVSSEEAAPASSRRTLVTKEQIQHYDRWKFIHHDHLKPREIRLFKLRGPSTDDPKRYEWEWIHISLDNLSVPYTAFSYTWGDPTPCSMMFLPNDQIIAISKSVDHILLYIVEENMQDYFWIDATCICQTNLEEKSAQVRVMDEIYSSAAAVVVHLGSPAHDSDMAMRFIPALYDTFERLEGLGIAIENHTFREPAEEDKLCQWPSAKWIALRRLLERDWFQRIWIVQEVVMGTNVVLVCGTQSVAWIAFAKAIRSLMTNGLSYLLSLESSGAPGSLASIDRINNLRVARRRGSPISLQALLLEFISFNATDPRDMVYALLSLANDGSSSVLDPDYSIPVQTTFIKSARHIMQKSESSALLHAAGIGYSRRVNDLPSWVPDFSLTRGGGFISNFLVNSKYKASGDTRGSIHRDLGSNRIALKGILIDKLSALSSMPKPDVPYHDWINSIAKMINSLQPNSSAESNHEIFWRTIIANRTHLREPATTEHADYYTSYITLMHMKAGEAANEDTDLEALSKTIQESSLFQMALNVNLSGRQAFITHGGRAGLTSPETLEGDLVCIILGATTPFILREDIVRDGEQCMYRLVGESYVHGLMDGKGLELGPVQDIVLT